MHSNPFAFVAHAQIQDIATSGCMVDNVPTLKCVEVLFGNLIFMSSALLILILFIMFIVGGFLYLTSFGDPEKIKKAQGTLKYALIGVVLYMSSFLILKTIDVVFLGNCGRIFKFEIPSSDTSVNPAPPGTPGSPCPGSSSP